jgi:hypothetical protein
LRRNYLTRRAAFAKSLPDRCSTFAQHTILEVRIVTERFIFCKGERLAYETISLITNKYNAQIFPHLRIKEVANRDWIKEEDFDYALKGHIDFTVAQNFRPVLALELDGRFHQSVKSRDRDRKKDELCDSLEIPLVRLDSGYLRPELLQPVLGEFVEYWLNGSGPRHPHLHAINATCVQLEEAANYNRDSLEIAESDEWHLQVISYSLDRGYSEARIELVFPRAKIEVGRGRSKMPKGSRICGKWLAERIAAAEAGAYIRTVAGTARDAYTEAVIPLEGSCADCSVETDNFIVVPRTVIPR